MLSRRSKRLFNIGRASLMQWVDGNSAPTNNALGTDGYCDAVDTTITGLPVVVRQS